MTPARLYFVRRPPERLDYFLLLGLILVIGLLAGTAEWASPRMGPWLQHLGRAPFWVLLVMSFEHVIHFHLARYPPLWNVVAAQVNRVGVSAVDGWFAVGVVCSVAVIAVFYFNPAAWAFAKPILCGSAAVVWLGCGWKLVQLPRPPADPPPSHAEIRPVRDMGPGNPVVWIILDEWDYDLTYRRSDGKIFPELERLRRESVFLENVRSAGKATLIAIPSLLTGKAVREYRPADPSGARFLSVGARSEAFPGSGTIFDAASRFGYKSQIVGWYHPYCRMFGSQVESCWWDDLTFPSLRPGRPIAERAFAFLRESIEFEILPVAGPVNHILKQLARVNPMVEQAALAASRPGRRFSFLHLPVPHGPFYKLAPDSRMIPLRSDLEGYQSGLDAADRAIGKIRAAMEQSGVWDEALVVVTSDHPYRYQFGGGYGNGHIPMMIKFPHQKAPVVYSPAFQAVETRRLLEDFMQGHVGTPQSAIAWLDRAAPARGAAGSNLALPLLPASPEPMSAWGNP